VQHIRAACDTGTLKGKRDIEILETMLFQGLRLMEVTHLRLGEFCIETGPVGGEHVHAMPMTMELI
jgi:hypothetical protein